MPCYWTEIRDKDGNVVGHAHVHARGRGRQRCNYCSQPGDKLCDGPVSPKEARRNIEGGESSCSRPICRRCAIHVPPDLDFCRDARCRQSASSAAAKLREAKRV